MIRAIWRSAVILVVLGVAASFAAPARAEEGVTATTIKLGTWQALSGPAVAYAIVGRTIEAYFKQVNEQGGINGRRIELLMRDDAYTPARTVAVVKELVENEKVFAFTGGLGTPTGLAVMDYLNGKGIPHVAPATGSSRWATPPKKYLFALMTNYAVESTLLAKHAIENLKKKKIAVAYQNDPFGKEGLEGISEVSKKAGVDLLAVSYETTDTDLSAQALKIRQFGADAVILWTIPKFAALMTKELAKIGYKTTVISSAVNADPVLFKLAGPAWEGVLCATWLPLHTDPDPKVEAYRVLMKKYLPNDQIGGFSLAGYAFAEPMAEGIKRAGKDLTRGSLVKALETFKNWNGGLSHNVTWGPNQRQGQNAVRFVRAEKGDYVYASDWVE